MCRLLGIVASEVTEFGLVLTGAPRSLAKLSEQHPDGWGLAIHDATTRRWVLHKGTERAHADDRFREVAAQSRGHVLVSHVRQKTVGPTRLENTHPFASDGWIFCHNGTVKRTDLLAARVSPARRARIEGETDSELLFAFLLTRLEEHGLVTLADEDDPRSPMGEDAREAATELLEEVVRELRAEEIGAFNFLLSDGATCFTHRSGRTLFLLERGPADPVRTARTIDSHTELLTPWTPRRQAILVASEAITDEPWVEVPEGALLRIDRLPSPHLAYGDLQVNEAQGKVA